jgi:uncharacterized RDD family membrane protein YckC
MDTMPVTYAGFWKRFAAHIIDNLVIGTCSAIIFVPVAILLGIGLGMSTMESQTSEEIIPVMIAFIGTFMILGLIAMILTWLYFALMESSSKQATLGKMVLGITVTDLRGNRITFGRASGRYFGKFLSGLTMAIGYMMAGFTEKKQALHDMIAGCLVVNKPFTLPGMQPYPPIPPPPSQL